MSGGRIAGAALALSLAVQGTTAAAEEPGGPVTDLAVFPRPSDHRAVLSTLRVVPDEAPPLVAATPRLVQPGASVFLRTWDPAGPVRTALVVHRGARPEIEATTVSVKPGDHELRLLHAESYVVLAKAQFRVMP